MTALLDAALGYAARGWEVFPIFPPKLTPDGAICSCAQGARCQTGPGKHPFTRWTKGEGRNLRDEPATSDAAVVRRWWSALPTANIGIATGARSGIFVVDVDKRSGGWDTLGQLDADRGWTFDTLRAFTPSGGAHFYYRHPGGEVVTGADVLGPGIDLRGDGGMVVAPPSLHKTGSRYQWHHAVDPTGPREPVDG